MRFTLIYVAVQLSCLYGPLSLIKIVEKKTTKTYKKLGWESLCSTKEFMKFTWLSDAVRFSDSCSTLDDFGVTKNSVAKMFSCVSEFSRSHQHLQCVRSSNVVHFWEWCCSLAPSMKNVKNLANQQKSKAVHFDIWCGSLALVSAIHSRS